MEVMSIATSPSTTHPYSLPQQTEATIQLRLIRKLRTMRHYSNCRQTFQNDTVANYNWITPNLYDDMHTPLATGFTYNGTHLTGDVAQIAQGDNFLSKVVPMIQASPAYNSDGVIIIWWDETEGGDGPSHTIGEIIIS